MGPSRWLINQGSSNEPNLPSLPNYLEPVGLSVITSDPAAFKQKVLHGGAKLQGSWKPPHLLDCPILIVPAEPNKLWIINGQVGEKKETLEKVTLRLFVETSGLPLELLPQSRI